MAKVRLDAGWGYFLLVAVFCFTWSSVFVVAKVAIATSPVNFFLGLRFLVGGAMLLAWAAWRGHLRPPPEIPWVRLMVLGLLNQTGYNGFSWSGMQTVSSGLTTVIASTNPLLIGVLAAPLLGDPLTFRRLAGLLLGIAGTVFLVRNRIHVAGEDPVGVLRVVAALACMVTGSVLFKLWSPKAPLSVVTGVQFATSGFALLAIGTATESFSAIVPGPAFWLTLFYTGVVATLFANTLWFLLLQRGSAVSASSLHFLMPPLGLTLGWAALGERIQPADLFAAAPIVVGIWLVTHPASGGLRWLRAWNPIAGSGSIDFRWMVRLAPRLGFRLTDSRDV